MSSSPFKVEPNMSSSAAVTIIPATIDRRRGTFRQNTKRRVVAYAWVSTDLDEQLNSYYAQVDYYTNLIRSNNEWEFSGVYTDEGITCTNTKRRKGFKDPIADALAGKVDLIVTKWLVALRETQLTP